MKIKAILFLILVTSVSVLAQEEKKEELKRPDNIKVAEYDNFKNTSFDAFAESAKLKDNLGVIDKDVKNYAGVMKSVLTPKLLDDLKAIVAIKSSGEALKTKIEGLDNQSKDLLENAKKAGLKAPAATRNTNDSVTALGKAKDNLKAVSDLINTDAKLIKDELKARGEPVE